MMNQLRRWRWARQLRAKVGDPTLVELLMRHAVIADRVIGTPLRACVRWPEEEVVTDLGTERFMIEGADYLPTLRAAGARWSRARDNSLLLSVGGVILAPQSREELLIATEIFHQGVYHFAFSRPTCVVDIGANVLTASLAFATNPDVVRVHAFEPLPANLARAGVHLALNPSLAGKIDLRPYGLGATSRRQPMIYDRNRRGSASTSIDPRNVARFGSEQPVAVESADVEIRSASEEITSIAAATRDCELWAKIDCEGGEDEIIPALVAAGAMKHLRGIVMETHQGNGPEHERTLARAGFDVWRPSPGSADLGYLLAFRRA